ncbi:hypothetical protein TrLO_g2682, partial [Triparma laevis f. longispina]
EPASAENCEVDGGQILPTITRPAVGTGAPCPQQPYTCKPGDGDIPDTPIPPPTDPDTPPPADCTNNPSYTSPPLYESNFGAGCSYFCENILGLSCEKLIEANYPNSPSYREDVVENCPKCCSIRCNRRLDARQRSLAQMLSEESRALGENAVAFAMTVNAMAFAMVIAGVFLIMAIFNTRAKKVPQATHARTASTPPLQKDYKPEFEGDATPLSPPSSRMRREMNGISSPLSKLKI